MEWYTNDAGEVRWRIFETDEEDGNILNKSTEGFKTEGGAKNNLLVTYTLLGAYFVSTIRGESFGAVEFYVDNIGKHRWRVTADNNEIVAASHKGFTTEGGAKNNILMTYTMISAYLAKATLEN